MQLTKTIPYAHQQQAIDMAKDRESFAYLMEQGTGKSLCLLADATYLYDTQKINCLIIVAPKGCYLNWCKNEIPKHMLDRVPTHIETWVAPSKQTKKHKERLKEFAEKASNRALKILVINVEALTFADTFKYLSSVLRNHSALVAVDESTFIRTPSSKRCMYARRIGALAKYRRILTGTPIANRPLDLYGQCAFLDPRLLGFPSYQTFKHYYADIGYFRGGKRLDPQVDNLRGPGIFPVLVGYRHLEELTETLNTFSFRVLKQDCLDLPDKVYETIYVEPTPEQKRLYNAMRDNMLAAHEKGAITTAPLALTQILRLQTILCGHLKGDDGVIRPVESNRASAWRDCVEEIDGKVITFCANREDIRLLTAELAPGTYAEFHGGNVSERESDLQRWKTDSLCPYLFATYAGGVGLTLNEANTVIYYSQGYDLEKRLQSEDRCHRIGQTNKVTYYDLVVPNSVDEKIVEVLKNKGNVADLVLSGLQSFVPSLS